MADISNAELKKEIQGILKDADLDNTSAKKVRLQLQEKLDVDLADRKKEVDQLAMEECSVELEAVFPAPQVSDQSVGPADLSAKEASRSDCSVGDATVQDNTLSHIADAEGELPAHHEDLSIHNTGGQQQEQTNDSNGSAKLTICTNQPTNICQMLSFEETSQERPSANLCQPLGAECQAVLAPLAQLVESLDSREELEVTQVTLLSSPGNMVDGQSLPNIPLKEEFESLVDGLALKDLVVIECQPPCGHDQLLQGEEDSSDFQGGGNTLAEQVGHGLSRSELLGIDLFKRKVSSDSVSISEVSGELAGKRTLETEQISLVPAAAQGGSAAPSGPTAVTCVPLVPHQQDFKVVQQQQQDFVAKRLNGAQALPGLPPNASLPVEGLEAPCALERDYYGCYCLKFIVKNGTHITEDKVMEDFGTYGEVVDVRGPGLFSGLRGNHVYVRFIDKLDAEEALRQLIAKYHQLTPASISDVLPDNYGLYTISFYNKTGIPSTEVRREFSKFGEVKNLTGSLDVKGGRVFVSYKNKNSAVEALQAFFFRKDRYPNMKFALPRCEKDYFGCYCLKFYNKTGEVTEQQVLEDFGMYGEVVDVRGPGLFDVTGDDVYVRYKEKSSAEQALIELVGRYDSLCLAPPSDIQADKFGYYTITFVNDKCLSKSDVWYIFSKFGTVACVNGTFDCKKGRVFVSYKEKQGALNALETMLITKEYHLQVSKNSTVRKNDYNIVTNPKENDNVDFDLSSRQERAHSEQKQLSRERSGSREASCGPTGHRMNNPPPALPRQQQQQVQQHVEMSQEQVQQGPPPPNHIHPKFPIPHLAAKNGLVKFNRNVEKDIFGYFCLSFLNEDGEISEKKVRHDFSKFGEVVSVRGALGKQKGHVFVRFRKKEAAENCLNCLNSFPLSEMSELFGRYLFLSPATPRDIDCDMFGLYSISFLNLNIRTFREIRAEFSKFGEIVRLTSGGGGNTDELVSISYSDKGAAVRALQTHFTNKDYPYLDIAKGSSLLLVNSSDSSDCEDHEGDALQCVRQHHSSLHPHHQELLHDRVLQNRAPGSRPHSADRVYHHAHGHHHGGNSQHDPFRNNKGAQAGSDVVDELLKPLQSYFSVFRTGQYQGGGGHHGLLDENGGPPAHNTRSHDKRYRIRKNQQEQGGKGNKGRGGEGNPMENGHHGHPPPHHLPGGLPNMAGPPPPVANGYGPHHVHSGPPPMLGDVETEIAHSLPPPNMAEPPPGMLGAPPYPPPHQPLLLLPSVSGPPPVLGSPQQQSSPPYPIPITPHDAQDESVLDVASSLSEEEQLEVAVSNISLSEQPHHLSEEQEEEQPVEEAMAVIEEQPKLVDEEEEKKVDQEDQEVVEVVLPPQPPSKDLFNLFSLAFICKSKDLSERKIRLEFGLVAEVCRVRGQPGKVDATVIVSFETVEDCMKCLEDKALMTKYPSLAPAPDVRIVADRDGYFSIEFTNAGMSGVREITNEFSRHGEIVKVQQGGARNAVKRVTVSYADLDSAMAALTHYAHSNDYRGITFTHECECVEMDT